MTLSLINYWLIPDVINDMPRSVRLDFDMSELFYAFYGLLLELMMILRPEGILPRR